MGEKDIIEINAVVTTELIDTHYKSEIIVGFEDDAAFAISYSARNKGSSIIMVLRKLMELHFYTDGAITKEVIEKKEEKDFEDKS